MIVLSMGLALAPIIAIFVLIYWKDKHDKEPVHILIIAFLLGILSAVPVYYIGEWLHTFIEVNDDSSWFIKLAYAIGLVGFTEEIMKYIPLRAYCYPRKAFDEPYDGIMYAVTISLGFATIENVLYVYNGGFETGLLRMFTAVPAHGIFGVIMGYFVGMAKYTHSKSGAFWLHVLGVWLAILFHGLYDYFLFLGWGAIALVSFAMLIVGAILSFKAMKIHKNNSPHLPDEESERLI